MKTPSRAERARPARPAASIAALRLALAATVAGCSAAEGVETRDLRCGSLPSQRTGELCARVERALEYTRAGGHPLIFASLGHYCTDASVQQLFCTPPAIELAVVEESLAFQAGDNMDLRLYACLLGLQRALTQAALPKTERTPALEVKCDKRP